LKIKRNSRVESKRLFLSGGITIVWLGRHIKEYKYGGIPIMRWWGQKKKIEFLSYRDQYKRIYPSTNFTPNYGIHRTTTLRDKYHMCLPPGVLVYGKLGRVGGLWVIFDKGNVPLVDHLMIDYEGVV